MNVLHTARIIDKLWRAPCFNGVIPTVNSLFFQIVKSLTRFLPAWDPERRRASTSHPAPTYSILILNWNVDMSCT